MIASDFHFKGKDTQKLNYTICPKQLSLIPDKLILSFITGLGGVAKESVRDKQQRYLVLSRYLTPNRKFLHGILSLELLNQMYKRKALMECLVWLKTNTHNHMYQLISSPNVFILLGRCVLCFGRTFSFEVVITLFYFLYECQVHITFYFPFYLPKPFNFLSSLHKYLINNYDLQSYSKHGP